ncbi:MAG: histidine kinase [Sedimenticolaceae bacterium]|nr:histidine kinase [Sedimenticolaceae bacterium]
MSTQAVSRQIFGTLRAARLIVPIALLLIGVSGMLVSSVGMVFLDQEPLWRVLMLLSIPLTLAGIGFGAWLLRSKLLKPLVMLQNSVARVSQGTPGAMVSIEEKGALDLLVQDIGSINEELFDLYEDMDSRVERQTRRLAQKTASLKILYDVAATINRTESLDELLMRFLRVLKEMVNGKAATVRLKMPAGSMKLVGSIGLDNVLLKGHELYPVQLCVCGNTLSPGEILCNNDARECSRINGRRMYGRDEIDVVTVPLDYHGDLLGQYSIYVEKPGIAGREDIMELLQTIGSHLGMTIAKQRSDEEAYRLSIIEERTLLAHELHDSLAQTLASLRFQVRMLSDTLHKDVLDAEAAFSDLDRIRNGLDEAHTELRALIGNFRAPVHERGLRPSLERIAERFHEETGIRPFLQLHVRDLKLHASEEMQLLRIVQEALANTRKHADAHAVRIMVSFDGEELTLLVEDDGIGFEQAPSGKPGEHIGLSIMQERASRMGGQLRIESEPGEGTRVEMVYSPRSRHEGDRDARTAN